MLKILLCLIFLSFCLKEGYREGAEAGKEVTVQQGFNQGYNEAAKFMFSCGQLKGTVRYVLKPIFLCKYNLKCFMLRTSL